MGQHNWTKGVVDGNRLVVPIITVNSNVSLCKYAGRKWCTCQLLLYYNNANVQSPKTPFLSLQLMKGSKL